MAYFLDLFSPETYNAFTKSDRSISGFRKRQENAAEKIRRGDKLVCYMTKLSRWFGLLEVLDGPFEDDAPIFYAESDPFVVRFHVRPIVLLPVDKAIPIFEDPVWNRLSFTRGQTRGTPTWTAAVRKSLVEMEADDTSSSNPCYWSRVNALRSTQSIRLISKSLQPTRSAVPTKT